MSVSEPRAGVRLHAGVVRDREREAVWRLVDADPLAHAPLADRLARVGTLDPRRLGGVTIGVHRGDELVAICFNGGNLLPVGAGPDAAAAWPLLASFVANRPRVCTSVAGRADAVAALWTGLEPAWGPPRAFRAAQPLLTADRPAAIAGDPRVRTVRPGQLERYLAASAAMFAEELGVSPYRGPAASGLRTRTAELIAGGRAFARVDFRGQIVFKAEIGALTPATAQLQGVWVRPDQRGRGLGTVGLAAVVAHALTLAPTVSLYVNEFNLAARRVYDKLEMRAAGTMSTVLL